MARVQASTLTKFQTLKPAATLGDSPAPRGHELSAPGVNHRVDKEDHCIEERAVPGVSFVFTFKHEPRLRFSKAALESRVTRDGVNKSEWQLSTSSRVFLNIYHD